MDTRHRTLKLNTVKQKVTGHLSEGSFVRNVVVQIPKFDAKPNPNLNSNPNPSSNRNPSHSPMPIRFGQMTLRTSELLRKQTIAVLPLLTVAIERFFTCVCLSLIVYNIFHMSMI